MAELAQLKRARAGHKATATKWAAEVDTLVTAVEGGAPLDKVRLAQLKRGFQDQLKAIGKLNDDIVALLGDETEVVEEISSTEDFKLTIHGAMYKIEQLEGAPPTRRSPPPPASLAPTRTSHRAKLPKLTLQHFYGDPTKWYSFWELYEATVHSNEELSDVEKFTYLRAALEKSALEAIAGLALTGENYKEAIEILEARYGNKQLIINKHMDILLDVPAVQSLSEVGALRRFYDKVESQIRSLRALGQTSDSYGSLLIPVLMKRLPQEFRLMLNRKMNDEDWTVNTIMKELEDEVKAREKAGSIPKNDTDRRHPRPTGVTLFTGGKGVTCCYCNKHGHRPEMCRTINRVDSRKELLRKDGRCFTCLSRGHISADCRGGQRCSNCKGRHHISICYKSGNDNSGNPDAQGGNSVSGTYPALNPAASSFSSTTTCTTCTRTNPIVLLQTTRAVAVNPDDRTRSIEVHIILDNGSQKSYVTNRIKRLLGLRTLGKKPLSIMTFGASEERRHTCDAVKIGLRTREGAHQEVQLLTVPLICEPIRRPSIQFCIEKYSHLRELELIESEGEIKPDVLIGSDHYWDFMTGEVIQGSEGPVAMYSTLGWILSGPVDEEEASLSTSLVTHVYSKRMSLQQKRTNG